MWRTGGRNQCGGQRVGTSVADRGQEPVWRTGVGTSVANPNSYQLTFYPDPFNRLDRIRANFKVRVLVLYFLKNFLIFLIFPRKSSPVY